MKKNTENNSVYSGSLCSANWHFLGIGEAVMALLLCVCIAFFVVDNKQRGLN